MPRSSDPEEDGDYSGGYTSRSCTQSEYGESEYGASECQSTSRSRGRGRDRPAPNDRGRKNSGYPENPEPADVPKIANLGDLRGGKAEKYLSSGVDEEQGGFTASSDARSVRSYAASESGKSMGGQSVASTSVRQYMGYLSQPKSAKEVKQEVKNFVREMVKGREMGVLRADGAVKPVTCGLSRAIDVFKIKSGDQLRKVEMKELLRVVCGVAEDLDDLETTLDEKCATLEFQSGECISFKFAERKKVEIFTMCMQMLADGQRK